MPQHLGKFGAFLDVGVILGKAFIEHAQEQTGELVHNVHRAFSEHFHPKDNILAYAEDEILDEVVTVAEAILGYDLA